jgi:hypothetical protein
MTALKIDDFFIPRPVENRRGRRKSLDRVLKFGDHWLMGHLPGGGI